MDRSAQSAGANAGVDSDRVIVDGLIAGDGESFAIAMRRYNQRLFRLARAVLFDDAEAEDVVQETWLRAFRSIGNFEKRSTFATWISRIALYEAWSRARHRSRRAASVRDLAPPPASDDPETTAFGREVHEHLGLCVDALPEPYRLVFILREIDGASTEETALSLGISAPAVKVRLHRARAMLRRRLGRDAGETEARAYRFGGERCDRTVATVLAVLDVTRPTAASLKLERRKFDSPSAPPRASVALLDPREWHDSVPGIRVDHAANAPGADPGRDRRRTSGQID